MSIHSKKRTHRRAPRPYRGHSSQLSRTALTGLVRGAATAVGTVLVGWLTTWTRDHL
ncbi:hypothetical protein ACIG0C_36160 [Kitasatospora aureofaciens]|uniref:Uncharacterized protein n=1 Tax=Kitasatospora aureofaciens TaxID=1894 RepID=A0A8H9LYE3_KITAU|nr:hypothetical protein [Kitasatospora aureofaciens]GGV07763.1 hypothetical protein GCM10010502_73510 [Kitasatospora aureofaciens]